MKVNGYEIKPDADLRDANLAGANLWYADLQHANLADANLAGADLRHANLRDVDLRRAKIVGAKFSSHQACPQEGSFVAWKRVQVNQPIQCAPIAKLEIPAWAWRTNAIGSRKCRASHARVLEIRDFAGNRHASAVSQHDPDFIYQVGKTVMARDYDPDVREECSGGIHFFATKEEAEEW